MTMDVYVPVFFFHTIFVFLFLSAHVTAYVLDILCEICNSFFFPKKNDFFLKKFKTIFQKKKIRKKTTKKIDFFDKNVWAAVPPIYEKLYSLGKKLSIF